MHNIKVNLARCFEETKITTTGLQGIFSQCHDLEKFRDKLNFILRNVEATKLVSLRSPASLIPSYSELQGHGECPLQQLSLLEYATQQKPHPPSGSFTKKIIER